MCFRKMAEAHGVHSRNGCSIIREKEKKKKKKKIMIMTRKGKTQRNYLTN